MKKQTCTAQITDYTKKKQRQNTWNIKRANTKHKYTKTQKTHTQKKHAQKHTRHTQITHKNAKKKKLIQDDESFVSRSNISQAFRWGFLFCIATRPPSSSISLWWRFSLVSFRYRSCSPLSQWQATLSRVHVSPLCRGQADRRGVIH